MNDFTMPYDNNEFNIPPAPENFIEPGKRPLSSMVPIIALDANGVVKLVVGGSGGARITSGVAQVWWVYSLSNFEIRCDVIAYLSRVTITRACMISQQDTFYGYSQ